jgi:hypothetical protein
MQIQKRWVAILPFACSLVSMTLALVILLAGNKPGYMEELSIIRVRILPRTRCRAIC